MKVWEHKVVTPSMAMQWSAKQISQWQKVQKYKLTTGDASRRSKQDVTNYWKAPEPGKLKINVDASVHAGTSSFALGMVLRDQNGGFCKAKCSRHEGEVTVFEAEAFGVVEALKWIMELGIMNVELESDSLLTVQAVNRGVINFLEVGNLINESRLMMIGRPDIDLVFVKKQANRVAHSLARVSCEVNCFIEFESPPPSVLENIMYDVFLI
ncbi:hypothetical protein DCAR_0936213 [Daucus carota subsp. sativus]|uniref:RNase H type-1 domain-containing protein n=1 Tax=Daucus carota subsp. sativus TaxID=79200 RepID=A0AAF1BEP1_DAUCS|nr:PREDICTED: uncharacterized protein LOC108201743 [Daucus carota subsp. sativus]WOH16655.1 hypothetical protein DCAR_0936213 [Daucus carota subsp. sativus]